MPFHAFALVRIWRPAAVFRGLLSENQKSKVSQASIHQTRTQNFNPKNFHFSLPSSSVLFLKVKKGFWKRVEHAWVFTTATSKVLMTTSFILIVRGRPSIFPSLALIACLVAWTEEALNLELELRDKLVLRKQQKCLRLPKTLTTKFVFYGGF